MKFRSYDNLRIFTIVARHDSFSAAAEELCLTKGAVSHQIRQLETELDFELFKRLPRGVSLTPKGQELLAVSNVAFVELEQKIEQLRFASTRVLTIGVTTYFASRWLSPRLMGFMQEHPDIRLRLQPMIDLMNVKGEGIDLTIRWGRGDWKDVAIELLFPSPAWPCGNEQALTHVLEHGPERAFNNFTLLHDREDSDAWARWFAVAGLSHRNRAESLIVPDPNVRVQAVIDGQGVALNDTLVDQELHSGKLHRLSDAELGDYGYYLAITTDAISNPDVTEFSRWLKSLPVR